MTATILATGLRDFVEFCEALPEIANEAAFLAVNDASRDTVPLLKRSMRRQINFPKGYLEAGRLSVRRKATRATLEAVISGRDRPTSLARFAQGANPENSKGRPLFVKIKPGQTVRLDRAFLLRLRNNNIGLAVRLKPGERLQNSEKAIRLDNNLYLLYGPSVDQVMRDTAEDAGADIEQMLSRNFLRQFARLSRG